MALRKDGVASLFFLQQSYYRFGVVGNSGFVRLWRDIRWRKVVVLGVKDDW